MGNLKVILPRFILLLWLAFLVMMMSRNRSMLIERSARTEDLKLQRRPMCDISSPRTDVCELEGDIRIHGNSSSILIVASTQIDTSRSWRVKPHARKADETAMRQVKEFSLRGSSINGRPDHGAPPCTVNYSIPGIVFSTGGYVGHIFHDYCDVLIPLYLTSHKYQGEVQFFTTDTRPFFISKHKRSLSNMTHYKMIDLDNDSEVRCFSDVIVGLRSHEEFLIDPLIDPVGYSMRNFTRFLRRTYSLKRDIVNNGDLFGRLPRLLLITRKAARSFTNEQEILKLIQEVGYEVVAMEVKWGNLQKTAETINSCDVLVGVHGAGLTNLIFLPVNATMIQIVPWGELGDVAMYDYGRQAINAGLKYLEHEINLEESSLIEQYPLDHPYIKNISAVHKQGWNAIRTAYLPQNVTLDVRRFKPVLEQVMKQLKSHV